MGNVVLSRDINKYSDQVYLGNYRGKYLSITTSKEACLQIGDFCFMFKLGKLWLRVLNLVSY